MPDRSYYSAPLSQFLNDDGSLIFGEIVRNNPHDGALLQQNAWLTQISLLQDVLSNLDEAHIFFEFMIPRMGKRADVVLVYRNIIFVIEFKVGADSYAPHYIEQAVDYGLDLKYFHEGSHNVLLVPILFCTNAPDKSNSYVLRDDNLASCLFSNTESFIHIINECYKRWGNDTVIDAIKWANSRYKPTPTIVQAAQALYSGHNVADISRSDAGAKNLQITGAAIDKIIEHSKQNNRKSICFVTGVPGAGKTLAGLNIATNHMHINENEDAVFLSGNGPLVEVLTEALARDEKVRNGITKKEAKQKAKKFIQNIHHFRDDNLQTTEPPIEKTVIFDEAQRAWDKNHTAKFMRDKKGLLDFDKSEPEFLIEVMDRHNDWCVIIALIGGGQEINTGEAGLPEWFSALRESFPHWDVYYSDNLDDDEYIQGGALAEQVNGLNISSNPDLHLGVSVRSFRAEKLSEFVHYLIANEPDKAKTVYQEISDNYPIVVTRDLQTARTWLREHARGSELFGLIASHGAIRLKPDGLNVKAKISASNWFLNGKQDVRSCQYLEDVGTEFDVQGLELDWCGVCWDADLRHVGGEWSRHAFKGTKWQRVLQEDKQRYLSNAYRVLLTRARQGFVIYVPVGDNQDKTRITEYYDGIYNYLKSCGLKTI